eukprot:CAMPEP_0173379004 /NCGR_PEP_ID=MMETSP1356-20130122/2104_1 /TAXON_ID=77927 ORGANISM="Hemiselmis virescens, Strain PCC157" /NCGR_SAMPLE_ID=MMETSP1356 /ASSEMBLY_ACC=CAM_ASM_000847 /LENGTH=343 /DNA_ID=CAMNT_0014332271 /DNA_START=1 /DNA_END=1032 /DNA_ORIENTATION=+
MGDNLPYVDLSRPVKAIASGASAGHMCAVLDDYSVKCWGRNEDGQLGLNDTNSRGGLPGQMGHNLPTVDLGAGRSAKSVAVGVFHTCALLDNGSVKCWGRNIHAQLGLGDTNSRGDNVDEMGDNLPTVDLGTGRTAKFISAGADITCALLDNDALKCWGGSTTGEEMGDNLPAVDLGTGRTARYISTGLSYYGHGTCAVLDNGSVKCWMHGSETTAMGDNLTAVNFGMKLSSSSSSSYSASNAPWLTEAVEDYFTQHAECAETRSWEDIIAQAAASTHRSDRFVSGGLGKLTVMDRFELWVCWRNHPCVAAVGGAVGDRMCYVKNEMSKEWHSWGLNSQLGLC